MPRVVSFRPATDADRPFLYAVYASTRQEEMAQVPWDAANVQAFLTMQFEAQHRDYHTNYDAADFLIIMIDDQPAGRLYVDRRPHEVHVLDIALLPAYRNAGIGSSVLQDLMAEAAATSRPVRLFVEPFNRALRLYQRLGFAKIDDQGLYWLMQWVPPDVSAD